MEKRKCGNPDFELPVLGVGCWSFGGGSYWGRQDQRDVDAVVHCALDRGCDFFDTAEAYNDGASEESLGKALKGRRLQATVGSKVSPSNTAPEILRKHCENSLRRLQTDYIDLYMVHWPIHPHAIRHFTDDESIINDPPSTAKAFETLTKLQKEGKIRFIGVSNFGVEQLTEALDVGAEIISNELPYSLLTRAIDAEILPLCQERGMGILAYMPLMQGLLAGKYATPDDVPSMRARTRHFSGSRPDARHEESGAEDLTFETVNRIKAIAEGNHIPMAHLALAWCMANPGITCVLAGARNISQLESNAQAASLSLSADLVEELNDVTLPLLEKLGSSPDYYENTNMSRTW